MNEIVVIDTNVFVSALLSNRGSSYALILKLGHGLFDIALSVPLVLEYEAAVKSIEVSKRPDDNSLDSILDYLCAIGVKIRIAHYLWRPCLRDPKDDHVLELAVSAGAVSVITFNKKDFSGIEKFGLSLFTPFEYLRRLEILS